MRGVAVGTVGGAETQGLLMKLAFFWGLTDDKQIYSVSVVT